MRWAEAFLVVFLVLFFLCAAGCLGFQVAARMGIGTEWYCAHLSTKEDTFCIYRGLKS